jgi:hypothetical protein
MGRETENGCEALSGLPAPLTTCRIGVVDAAPSDASRRRNVDLNM